MLCIKERAGKGFCKAGAKCNVKTEKAEFIKAPVTCDVNNEKLGLRIRHL